jgi:hypothetical protein
MPLGLPHLHHALHRAEVHPQVERGGADDKADTAFLEAALHALGGLAVDGAVVEGEQVVPTRDVRKRRPSYQRSAWERVLVKSRVERSGSSHSDTLRSMEKPRCPDQGKASTLSGRSVSI